MSLGQPMPGSDLPCGDIDPLGIPGLLATTRTGLVFRGRRTADARHTLAGIDLASGAVVLRRSIPPPQGAAPPTRSVDGARRVGVRRLRGIGDCGDMGVVAPITATGIVVPVFVGLAEGDLPSWPQLVGIGAIVVGVIAVSGPQLRRSSTSAGVKPILLAMVAAAGFGLWAVCMAQGARFSVPMTLVVMRVSSIAVIVIGLMVTRRRSAVMRADLPLLAAIGASEVGANAAYAAATRTGALSVVAVLASLYPAVTVLLARQLHGERLRRVQLAGITAPSRAWRASPPAAAPDRPTRGDPTGREQAGKAAEVTARVDAKADAARRCSAPSHPVRQDDTSVRRS